jgi:tRNA pseudouridine38-40 synthase
MTDQSNLQTNHKHHADWDGPLVASPDKLRIKLVVAYDGTKYSGWQFQKSGISVQQKLEDAIQSLIGVHCRVHSSSRTDAGVHAMGMVAHVDLPKHNLKIHVPQLLLAINAHLPKDIRVMSVSKAPPNFHARFSSCGKQYRYFVWNHKVMNPLLWRLAWHVPFNLNFKDMEKAASIFIGKHDFTAFASNRGGILRSAIRTIYTCKFKKQNHLITFVIEGDGFLYKMCRGIVGTIIQVGCGKFPPEKIIDMLKSKDRTQSGMNAPAHGLVLWKVFYRKPKTSDNTNNS